jgi:ABC-type nitrate/sulfonate/bicarbonate transport system substrate-binding protein
LPESLTFSAAAAPTGTLVAVLTAVVLAVAIVVPGFVLLYVLHQKGLLPEEGVDDVTVVGPRDYDRKLTRKLASSVDRTGVGSVVLHCVVA